MPTFCSMKTRTARLNSVLRAAPAARSQVRRQRCLRMRAELISEGVSSAPPWVYAGLGSAALSFLGTFFVVPQFKGAFKETVDWKDIYPELLQLSVRTVTPEEAYAKQQKGAVLLDVRMASKAQESSPAGSVNVPLYLPIQEWDLPSNIRRLAFAFFGMFGTELNTEFMKEIEQKIPQGREVVVLCESGGSLETKPGAQFGFQSRSLKALYFLRKAGYKKAYNMQGGFGQWVRDDLPVDEPSEAEAQQSTQSQPTVVLSVLERLLTK